VRKVFSDPRWRNPWLLSRRLVGTLRAMPWIWVFPPNWFTSGPGAEFNTAFGAGLVGELIATFVVGILGLQGDATKAKQLGVDQR
jgi:hypothetical protein